MENRLAELVEELTSLAQRIDALKLEILRHRSRADAAIDRGQLDTETLFASKHTLRAVAGEIETFRTLVKRNDDIAGVQHGQINGFAFALENLTTDCHGIIADLTHAPGKARSVA